MHNIETFTFPTSVSKTEIEKQLNNHVKEATYLEGGGGLYNRFRWIEGQIYNNYNEADQAITKLDRGDYDNLAVKYYQPKKAVSSKKLTDLQSRELKAYKAYFALRDKVHYEDVKSSFISCKSCGSKLASQFFGKTVYNVCPLCKKDLRPQTVLDKIEAAKNKWNNLKDEIAKEQQRLERKADKAVYWLVKIEYHT